MIRYGSTGWQTTLADLSLILFIIALAALVQQADKDTALAVSPGTTGTTGATEAGAEAPLAANPLPAEGEAVAIYRPGSSVPGFAQWLAGQTPDPRVQLTIIARYSPSGGIASASARAMALAQEAQSAGFAARIVMEPAQTSDISAVLGYDRASDLSGER